MPIEARSEQLKALKKYGVKLGTRKVCWSAASGVILFADSVTNQGRERLTPKHKKIIKEQLLTDSREHELNKDLE